MIDAGLYVTTDSSLGRRQLIGEFDSLIRKDPKPAAIYAGRADAYARLGEWKEATADLMKAIALIPAPCAIGRSWDPCSSRRRICPAINRSASGQSHNLVIRFHQ